MDTVNVKLSREEWVQVLRTLRLRQDDCRRIQPKQKVYEEVDNQLEVVKMKIVKQIP